MHVADHAPAIVDDEDLLAAGVDDHPERRSQRGDEHRELPLLLLELLERARTDVLGDDPVHGHRLDADHVQELRKELRGRAVRVIDHDLRLRLGDLLAPRDLREERFAVGLADTRGLEYPADVLVRNAAQVLPEEDGLYFPLLRPVHVERLAIEELHVADAHVERRDAHVHAAGGAEASRVEPPDREWRLRKVGDVYPGADDAAHEPAFQHAARSMLVAVHRDRRAQLQCRRVGGPKPCYEFRGEVDVDDAGHAEPAEEPAPSLGAPDEARSDHGARLDLLVGPDLHLRANAGVVAHDGVVADDAAFLEDHARLQGALPADERAVQLRPFADIRVPPDDRAIDDCADVDRDVVPQYGRSDDFGVRSDLHAFAQEDGAGELGRLVDVDVARRPDAGHELVREVIALHLPAQQIGVGPRVFGDGTHIGPVPLGDVPEERLTLREQTREEVFAEVEDLAKAETLEDPRLDDVDPGVDRVAEDLAPGRFLEELDDSPVLAGDHDAVLQRIWHVHQRQRDGGLALAMERDDLRQVDVRESIAGDNEERAVEIVGQLPDRPARAERSFLHAVTKPHPDPAAVPVAVLDDGGEVLKRDERVLDAVALEELEDVPEARLVDDGHHRLRTIDRQRSKTAPLAARHDDGLHCRESSWVARSSGTPPAPHGAPLRRPPRAWRSPLPRRSRRVVSDRLARVRRTSGAPPRQARGCSRKPLRERAGCAVIRPGPCVRGAARASRAPEGRGALPRAGASSRPRRRRHSTGTHHRPPGR